MRMLKQLYNQQKRLFISGVLKRGQNGAGFDVTSAGELFRALNALFAAA